MLACKAGVIFLFYQIFSQVNHYRFKFLQSFSSNVSGFQCVLENNVLFEEALLALNDSPQYYFGNDYMVCLTELVKEGRKEVEHRFSDYPWINDFLMISLGLYEKGGFQKLFRIKIQWLQFRSLKTIL